MNAKKMLLLAITMATFSVRAAADRIDVSELPQPVRDTLERSRAGEPVKQATRQLIDGRTVYIIEIERDNAPNPRLRIAEDGTTLTGPQPAIGFAGDGTPVLDPYDTSPVSAFPKLQLTDLPDPVQQTARSEARGREIVDIDRETWNRQPVYEIEFKERGLNSRVYIDERGSVVREERSSRPATLKSLFMGTQIEDTPTAVQQTIRRVAGNREISDIDRKTRETRTVYRVEIKSPEGDQELHIAEDGAILFDSNAAGRQPAG
jgi:uncharacterized membrane protein YkoI